MMNIRFKGNARPLPAATGIAATPQSRFIRGLAVKQRGVVLFFALIALVAMSLAAVALIRSVDTGAMIAGNLAFKQAAIGAGNSGVEAAKSWLDATQAANDAKDVLSDTTHAFNLDDAANGYYSNADLALRLTDSSALPYIKWDGTDSVCLPEDSAGNTVCYVIQRMCRTANTVVANAECLFGMSPTFTGYPMGIPYPDKQCIGPDCPKTGETPLLRITVRISDPRGSFSYLQAFVL
jgi:hypothetical protein